VVPVAYSTVTLKDRFSFSTLCEASVNFEISCLRIAMIGAINKSRLADAMRRSFKRYVSLTNARSPSFSTNGIKSLSLKRSRSAFSIQKVAMITSVVFLIVTPFFLSVR